MVEVNCIVRFRLTLAQKTYIARGNSDGSWHVAESNGRVLAAPGPTYPTPMRLIKSGKSATAEQIADDLAARARDQLGADVTIESI